MGMAKLTFKLLNLKPLEQKVSQGTQPEPYWKIYGDFHLQK